MGIASEGAFGVDPYLGTLPWNVEIVTWVDRKAGIEVTGIAQGPALAVGERVSTVEQLHQLAERAGFPEHLLMLRSDDEHHAHVIKAVGSLEALQKAYAECWDQSTFGGVFVESDLRAFANPTRQAMI